VYYGV